VREKIRRLHNVAIEKNASRNWRGGCGARWQKRRTFDKKGNFEPKGVIAKDKIEGRQRWW